MSQQQSMEIGAWLGDPEIKYVTAEKLLWKWSGVSWLITARVLHREIEFPHHTLGLLTTVMPAIIKRLNKAVLLLWWERTEAKPDWEVCSYLSPARHSACPHQASVLERVLHGPFSLSYLAMEDNAGSHYVPHWAAQKIRAARSTSEVFQSPSAWLLWMSLSALCPAGICQSHDQLQAKGNCICQELLWEFSLIAIFCCCSLAFLFPLGFLYFALTVL